MLVVIAYTFIFAEFAAGFASYVVLFVYEFGLAVGETVPDIRVTNLRILSEIFQ